MSDTPERHKGILVWVDDSDGIDWWKYQPDRHPVSKSDWPTFCSDYSELIAQMNIVDLIDKSELENIRGSLVEDGDLHLGSGYIVDVMLRRSFISTKKRKTLQISIGGSDSDIRMATQPPLAISTFSLGLVFANPEEVEDQLESLEAIYRYHCGRLGHRPAIFLMNWHLFITIVWRVWMSLPLVKGISAIVQKWTGANS